MHKEEEKWRDQFILENFSCFCAFIARGLLRSRSSQLRHAFNAEVNYKSKLIGYMSSEALSSLHNTRMLQNTTRFVISLLLACYAFEINAGQSVSECEIHEYERCFGVYVDAYRNADKTKPLLDIYCSSYKVKC